MDNPQTKAAIDTKTNSKEDPLIGKLFFGKYKVSKKLGEGSFGMIYKAEFQGDQYALKLETKLEGEGLLESEAMMLTYLKGPRIPFAKAYGYSGDYNVLVMELLGISLEDLMEKRKKFTVKTVAMLGFQMVTLLEQIHNKHIIHRDIKPDNFVLGLEENNQFLYMIDFGLAKKYRSSKTLVQYPLINKKKLTGTARYASINALRGYEQSRRDDLEAVSYVLMYLVRGSLPWQGLPVKNKEDRYKKIMIKKEETSSNELCFGYPKQFEILVEYARRLEYTEEPDYEMCRELFTSVVSSLKWSFDYIYDWSTKEEIAIRSNGTNTFKTEPDSTKIVNNIQSKLTKHLSLQTMNSRNDCYNRGRDININININNISSKNREKDNDKEKERDSDINDKAKRLSSREDVLVYKTVHTEMKTQRTTHDKVDSKCCMVF